MASYPVEALHFPQSERPFLEPYLPSYQEIKISPIAGQSKENEQIRPFTTLTFATSLDSSLSIAPGVRTVLSGPQSKAMTHYLRSRHDAILIGVGTAIADDPGLNCRIEGSGGYGKQQIPTESSGNDSIKECDSGEAAFRTIREQQGMLHQPRPIIIDPRARWMPHETSKIFQLVKEGRGKAPFVVIAKSTDRPPSAQALLEKYGGKYIALETISSEHGSEAEYQFDWDVIFKMLATRENIKSLMIEGGGAIINSLLSDQRYSALIDSVIVTIAPTWLGQGGVVVSPQRCHDTHGNPIPASRLRDVKWYPFGEDVVLCGRIKEHESC